MRSEAAELFGVEVPIVLAPFGGLSSVELAGCVSDAGGLGSYGLYGYDRARILEVGAALRTRTARPFGVNLWLPFEAEGEAGAAEEADDAFAAQAAALEPFFREVGMPVPERPARFLPPFEEQLEAVLEVRPRVLSVVFGVPGPEVVAAVRERGIVLVGTATTVEEARALEAAGVDAIVATGAEAAGHRVSFLAPAEDSLVGTLALVPQVADAVSVPVLAAGGIADRRGVRAAFALGASGVQIGTAFLATRQSAAPAGHRAAIRRAAAHDTVLTRAMSGRLSRGLPNRAVRGIEASGPVAPFPVQNWLTGRFRAKAAERDEPELLSLWMGQAAALATEDDADAVFAELRAGLPG